MIQGSFQFMTLTNNINLSSFLLLMTIGQAIVITTGDGAIDLSFPYLVSFAPYFIQLITRFTGNYFIGLFSALLVCILIGLLNGTITYYLRVPAMITTLAVGYIISSIMLIISGSVAGTPNDTLRIMMQKGTILGIPTRIIFTLIIAAISWFLLYRTKYGWHLHAVGMNRKAAGFAGINVPRTVLLAFVISAVLNFFASIMLNGYLGMGGQQVGNAYLLPSVAAAIIGGTSLQGGKSSVMGAVMASIMWTMLNGFLNMAFTIVHINFAFNYLIQGAVLILVLIVSVPKRQLNE